MIAEVCKGICSLPWTPGDVFCIILGIGSISYVFAGLAYAVTIGGKTRAGGIRGLLPHHSFWAHVRELVLDGLEYSSATRAGRILHVAMRGRRGSRHPRTRRSRTEAVGVQAPAMWSAGGVVDDPATLLEAALSNADDGQPVSSINDETIGEQPPAETTTS